MVDALWLIGSDISTSLSPAMQNAGLRAALSTLRYDLHPTPRHEFAEAFALAQQQCRGVNVTAPFKADAFTMLRGVADDDAIDAGAVNTVVFADHEPVFAGNTDVHGLVQAWRRAAVSVEDRIVTIVGAGGAARAAVVAAARARARGISVIARDPGRAEALLSLAASLRVDVVKPDDAPPVLAVVAVPHIDDADELIARALPHPAVVHDLRVRPPHALRDAALRRRHFYIDGTTMLLAQGERALAHFLGHELSDDTRHAMRDALVAAKPG